MATANFLMYMYYLFLVKMRSFFVGVDAYIKSVLPTDNSTLVINYT